MFAIESCIHRECIFSIFWKANCSKITSKVVYNCYPIQNLKATDISIEPAINQNCHWHLACIIHDTSSLTSPTFGHIFRATYGENSQTHTHTHNPPQGSWGWPLSATAPQADHFSPVGPKWRFPIIYCGHKDAHYLTSNFLPTICQFVQRAHTHTHAHTHARTDNVSMCVLQTPTRISHKTVTKDWRIFHFTRARTPTWVGVLLARGFYLCGLSFGWVHHAQREKEQVFESFKTLTPVMITNKFEQNKKICRKWVLLP